MGVIKWYKLLYIVHHVCTNVSRPSECVCLWVGMRGNVGRCDYSARAEFLSQSGPGYMEATLLFSGVTSSSVTIWARLVSSLGQAPCLNIISPSWLGNCRFLVVVQLLAENSDWEELAAPKDILALDCIGKGVVKRKMKPWKCKCLMGKIILNDMLLL